MVTGGIVSCQDSKWLLSWTINRQGQFKEQEPEKVCVWVYGLFTDVPGDYVKKAHEGVYRKGDHPGVALPHRRAGGADPGPGCPQRRVRAHHDALHHRLLYAPDQGDRPDVIPDGCVNFAFLGQFADTPRDTVFTTEYSVRTAMEAVYGLLGVDRGVPEVWGSVYDIRELLHSTVCLMDGRSPLEVSLPGPLELLKKPLLKAVRGTVIEKVLRDQDVLRDGM